MAVTRCVVLSYFCGGHLRRGGRSSLTPLDQKQRLGWLALPCGLSATGWVFPKQPGNKYIPKLVGPLLSGSLLHRTPRCFPNRVHIFHKSRWECSISALELPECDFHVGFWVGSTNLIMTHGRSRGWSIISVRIESPRPSFRLYSQSWAGRFGFSCSLYTESKRCFVSCVSVAKPHQE